MNKSSDDMMMMYGEMSEMNFDFNNLNVPMASVMLIAMLMTSKVDGDARLKGLTDDCLRCICAASSECDPAVRCHSEGPAEYYCGPYQFSQRYWLKAGAPGRDPSDPFDYEDCANDISCAITTVQNYMAKFAADCDQDGWITCADFALLHKAGPKKCRNVQWAQSTKYWKNFMGCAQASQLTL
ncbi:Lysozyme 1 [Halotydeus destructor]|nr:Lysozyme 1 [Halotydeus destructor]